MEATERRVVLILADISGYTRFIVANQTTAVHGQMVIGFLIETLLKEVDIPLTLHGIEGDAVFLSASHPGDDAAWQQVLADVRAKLDRFFEVFLDGVTRIGESTICDCAACGKIDELRLKIIVHSGRAVFSSIAGLLQVSGTDVILAHRLLKNSVGAREYLLMTDAAYQDLGCHMHGEFAPSEEECEGIGPVKTWVRLMGDDRERAVERFYAAPEAELEAAGRQYALRMMAFESQGIVDYLLRPLVPAPLPRRLFHALKTVLLGPLAYLRIRSGSPRRLLAARAARAAASGR